MNNTIQYKGYVGSIEFSEEDKIFIWNYVKNPVKHRKPLSREVLMYGFLLSCTKKYLFMQWHIKFP